MHFIKESDSGDILSWKFGKLKKLGDCTCLKAMATPPSPRSRSRSPTNSEVEAGIDANFLRFLRRNIMVNVCIYTCTITTCIGNT